MRANFMTTVELQPAQLPFYDQYPLINLMGLWESYSGFTANTSHKPLEDRDLSEGYDIKAESSDDEHKLLFSRGQKVGKK